MTNFGLHLYLLCTHLYSIFVTFRKVGSVLKTLIHFSQNLTPNLFRNSFQYKYCTVMSKVITILYYYNELSYHTENIQTQITQESYVTLHTHKSFNLRITHNTFKAYLNHTNISKDALRVCGLYRLACCLCVIKIQNVHFKLILSNGIFSIQSFLFCLLFIFVTYGANYIIKIK